MAKHPPPPPGAERRVHPRKDVFAQVEVQRGNVIMVVAALNLSLGGAFFEMPDAGMIESGDEVTVHLNAGEHDTVQPARVVRMVGGEVPGFAVMWLGRKPETLVVLSSLME